MGNSSPALKFIGLFLLMILLFVADVGLGSTNIALREIFAELFYKNSTVGEIIWNFRLPKATTCLLAGAALAAGGLLMQTLFRNALAGPDVLGLSSGASLMVGFVLMLGQTSIAFLAVVSTSPWSQVVAASLGGVLVFVLIIAVARFVRDNTSLLIIGLMISAGTSSLVAMLQFVSRAEDLQSFIIWSMGSVGSTNWQEVKILALVVLIGIGIAMSQVKSLNALLLGESYARSLGINLSSSRLWIVVSTSLLAGSVTAFCGPIAFVGLAVPHLIRLAFPTANHKILLPLAAMGGSSMLLLCDLLAHLPNRTQVLPINVITSLIGAPLVIWMIIGNKKVSV
ncbi:MAG: iron ABC transporter permease [Cytophagales bacterium]|jgi:iron complex transport system permease protein|nr:iron ABC transporter permease [Cytophagales bacterium]MCA6388322.1 iron ABC transporter permease [Cytophagales bacterium]MCA6392335.1 iron ABC transporter permease [Cytophagales bacterium]MCA6394277.1 iron ABC transporter permease [Cytophagales bacterium]MCA6398566.1 iron ABC transporter permease [Cytophagales bacterium]